MRRTIKTARVHARPQATPTHELKTACALTGHARCGRGELPTRPDGIELQVHEKTISSMYRLLLCLASSKTPLAEASIHLRAHDRQRAK